MVDLDLLVWPVMFVYNPEGYAMRSLYMPWRDQDWHVCRPPLYGNVPIAATGQSRAYDVFVGRGGIANGLSSRMRCGGKADWAWDGRGSCCRPNEVVMKSGSGRYRVLAGMDGVV